MGYEQKIQSCIKSELIYTTLKKGALLSSFGAGLIILCGSFLPLSLLKILGIPIFFVGLFFIALGLLPYRKLSRLQFNPHELQKTDDFLIFIKSKKPLFKIPKGCIAHMEYIEKERLYGISITLKKPSKEKVKVLQASFNYSAFVQDSFCRFGCDLFLPYFLEKDIESLVAKNR